jgi:hypothetical protein
MVRLAEMTAMFIGFSSSARNKRSLRWVALKHLEFVSSGARIPGGLFLG